MPRLPNSLRDRQTDCFALTLKSEIGNLPAGTLPLDQGVTQGGYVDDSDMAITVLHATEDDASIQAKVGVFFTEIVASCGCGDEPMPTNAYCDMQVRIDKATAEAEFTLIPE
jgi:hypothetical protein